MLSIQSNRRGSRGNKMAAEEKEEEKEEVLVAN